MGDTPSLFGRGPFGRGLYSRTHSDAAATVVINMAVLMEAQRVATVGTQFSVSPVVESEPKKIAQVNSVIGLLVGTVFTPVFVRGVSATIEAQFLVNVLADRVNNAVVDIPIDIDFVAGFNRIDASAVVGTAFSTDLLATALAGGRVTVEFGMPVLPLANKTGSGAANVFAGVDVLPRASYSSGVSTTIEAKFLTSGRVQAGEFWNDTVSPDPDWQPKPDEFTIWTPVNREHPFDA